MTAPLRAKRFDYTPPTSTPLVLSQALTGSVHSRQWWGHVLSVGNPSWFDLQPLNALAAKKNFHLNCVKNVNDDRTPPADMLIYCSVNNCMTFSRLRRAHRLSLVTDILESLEHSTVELPEIDPQFCTFVRNILNIFKFQNDVLIWFDFVQFVC